LVDELTRLRFVGADSFAEAFSGREVEPWPGCRLVGADSAFAVIANQVATGGHIAATAHSAVGHS